MVKFRGTQGKWRIGDNYNQVTISKPGILVGSEKICEISSFSKARDEIEANAKLIAAAPDLLEALIEILPIAEEFINANHPSHKKAIEVIKKATE